MATAVVAVWQTTDHPEANSDSNGRREARRFAPSLKLTFLHPAETDRQTLERIAKSPDRRLRDTDLAITTYSMLTRQKWLTGLDWRLVILDEAQAIKNPTTRQSKEAKKLRAQARIILTGTPVENRLADLWSLFDFLNPGLLGSTGVFKSFIKNLQARQQDQFAPLRRLVGADTRRAWRGRASRLRDRRPGRRFWRIPSQRHPVRPSPDPKGGSAAADPRGATRPVDPWAGDQPL